MPGVAIAPVVLAAGSSHRFGADKLASSFRGKPLLRHVLDRLAEARAAGLVGGGVLVHRPDDHSARSMARAAGLRPVVNPDPDRGMASSLRLGVEALADSEAEPSAEWALIVLGDQPLLRLEVIDRLARATGPELDLIRPGYSAAPSEPGHPVLAHRRVWPRARELAGDHGFGALVRSGPLRAAVIPVTGRNPDVDRPDDLAALEAAGLTPDG